MKIGVGCRHRRAIECVSSVCQLGVLAYGTERGEVLAELNVEPADLLRVADDYAELAVRTGQIAPRAVDEANRILATHGTIGYPVAVGIVAGLASPGAQGSTGNGAHD